MIAMMSFMNSAPPEATMVSKPGPTNRLFGWLA
jgi:hypothetical protein